MTSLAKLNLTASLIIIVISLIGCQQATQKTTQEVTQKTQDTFNTPTIAQFDNIQQTSLQVYIADSANEQAVGLGDIPELPATHGMLFIYSQPAQYSYWMKGVEYPIDIIWLKEMTVVDITPNIQPEDPSTALQDYARYSPAVPVDGVLEVTSGLTDQVGIEIGHHLTVQP